MAGKATEFAICILWAVIPFEFQWDTNALSLDLLLRTNCVNTSLGGFPGHHRSLRHDEGEAENSQTLRRRGPSYIFASEFAFLSSSSPQGSSQPVSGLVLFLNWLSVPTLGYTGRCSRGCFGNVEATR